MSFSGIDINILFVQLPVNDECVNVIGIDCKLVKGGDRLRHCLRNKIYVELGVVLMVYRFSVDRNLF